MKKTEKRENTAMDVGQVDNTYGGYNEYMGKGWGGNDWEQWFDNWPVEETNGEESKEENNGEVNAVGNVPTPFAGKCDHCQIPGHKKELCPYLNKPGAFYNNCYNCGLYGHSTKACPFSKGKGKGDRGKGKGGKGGKAWGKG